MYKKRAHVHFVGIGGIGMSGIAKILSSQGYRISGCDKDLDQQSVKDLLALGCNVYEGNNTPSCHDESIDILVYSSAIQAKNPEIVAAQQRGIPTIARSLMLAELMRTKYSIAIAGSHGKTTTTSLISHILIEAHIDPTVIIGGHLKNISTNARFGDGEFLVAEADESDRSLLNLQATLAVVTNIDLEHLETYRDIDDIKDTFSRFLNNLPFYGKAFVCIDDENVAAILPIAHIKTIKYGMNPESADLYAYNVHLEATHSTFDVYFHHQLIGSIVLNMPGKHNVLNCLAAIAVARDIDISFDQIAQAVATFKGIERRFSYHGICNGAEVFDDYGHHPKEIENTLIVAKKRAHNKLTVVFQPHRYTRTHKLWQDFVDTFIASGVDHLIITDIYAASEEPIANITATNLVQAIQAQNPSFTVSYVPFEDNFASLKTHVCPLLGHDDLLLLLGAGKINRLADDIAL